MYIDEILCISSFKSRKILLQMLDTLDNFITNVNYQCITTALHEYRYIHTNVYVLSKYIFIQKVPFVKQLPPLPFHPSDVPAHNAIKSLTT